MKSAMYRLLALVTLVASAVAGLAQTATPAQRMDSIWYAVREVLVDESSKNYDKGDFPRSIQILRVVADIWPHDYESIDTLGWLLESTDQKGEALARYIAYKKNNPDDPDAPLLEATFYFRNKLYAKVPPLLEPALKRKPHPNAYRQLARAYEQMSMLADSKRVLTTFIEDFPNDGQAKVNLERVERKIRGEEPRKE